MNRKLPLERYLVLLRNNRTKLFYGGPGKWLNNPRQATTFETIETAISARAAQELVGTDVICYYPEVECQVALSVEEWW